MKVSKKVLDEIQQFEGFSDKAYLCPAGKATIGFGFTYYPNGKKVTLEDNPINKARATEILKEILKKYEDGVSKYLKVKVTQAQFDALISFAYNVGLANLKSSTLLKKVNRNPQDPSIADEFKRWNKVHGKPVKGLTLRRIKEAARYFSAIVILLFMFSCSCPKPVIESEKTKEITDVKHRFTFHDTVFLTKPKAVAIEIPTVCEPFKSVKKQNGNAKVRVEYKDRKIYVRAECDTVKLLAKLKHEYTDSIRTITHEVTKVQRVKYTPKFVKILAGIGLLALLLIGIGLFLRIKKFI